MKKFFRITIYAIIFSIIIITSKNVFADEIKKADVKYGNFTDSGVPVTITFSQTIPDTTKNKLISDGWTVNDKIATKTAIPGAYYMYSFNNEKATITVPNKATVGDTIKLAGLGSDISDITIADTTLGEVNGTNIIIKKAGDTTYSVKILGETLIWNLKIEDKSNPITPTYKDAVVTYGKTTKDGVLVTITFSKNIPTDVINNLKEWKISENKATRAMLQGATAKVIVKYQDGLIETAKVAVPLTFNIGDQLKFGASITNLKSLNSDIVSVKDNILTAKAQGTTKIVATKNNEEYTWEVTVNGKDNNQTDQTGNDSKDDPKDNSKDDSKDNSKDNKQDDNSNSSKDNQGDSSQNNNSANNEKDQPNNSSKNLDKTTSNRNLAKTGYASVAPIFIALLAFAIISFRKYIKCKNK